MGAVYHTDALGGYGASSSSVAAAQALAMAACSQPVGSRSLQPLGIMAPEGLSQRQLQGQDAVGTLPVRQVTVDAPGVARVAVNGATSSTDRGDRESSPPPLDSLGPAAAATTTQAPSDSFARWVSSLERSAEERLLHEARLRFITCSPEVSLYDFKQWINAASSQTDEATLQAMRRAQLRCWMLCVSRKRRGCSGLCPQQPAFGQFLESSLSNSLPCEVRDRIDSFTGGRHVWGPINAARARAVAEAAVNQLRRSERVMRAAALAALVARYVHPAVVQHAEAGHMQCSTEIPTDDVALQALFEVTNIDVGAALAEHLMIDGFEVDPKYHDPEYGLWRGFWVDKCNRLRLTLMW